MDLPTYAFQREHFWLASLPVGSVDGSGLGARAVDHPLLSAEVSLAEGDGLVLTGRLSLQSHGWLVDHVVLGSVLLPGTAFVELVLYAGERVGCGYLEELTLQAPLVMPERGGMSLQLSVGGPSADGRRVVSVHSRSAEDADGEWVRHATGVLSAVGAGRAVALEEWPPRDATAVGVDGFYEELLGLGYGYGPAFQGLRAVWRRGDEVFAEVALPEEISGEGFGVHPALLDSALHAMGLSGGRAEDAGGTGLPFAWSGVSLHAVGASVLRVRIAPAGSGVSLVLADAVGGPVASVDSLVLRPVSAEQVQSSGVLRDALFRVGWVEHALGVEGVALDVRVVAALDVLDAVPGVVAVSFAEAGSGAGDVVSRTHEVAG
ncbi:polyketide synthase dehydratase domain-containing protein, partial [Streptomyces sp. SM10]|uniref:polyketide synthase dehydratase domain-containing protein n=1 Tax=Streptomyces sp. SM10 TaxID=565556 RepID=UPI00215631A4